MNHAIAILVSSSCRDISQSHHDIRMPMVGQAGLIIANTNTRKSVHVFMTSFSTVESHNVCPENEKPKSLVILYIVVIETITLRPASSFTPLVIALKFHLQLDFIKFACGLPSRRY